MKTFICLGGLFIAIIIYNICLNFYRLHRCQKLLDKYNRWLSGKNNQFKQDKAEILSLFKNANVKDSLLPVSQPVGFGQIANFTTSTQANITKITPEVVAIILDMFDEAIGYYRFRLRQCINPLFWIEKLVFLPKSLFLFLGVNSEKLAWKLCTILLYLIWWIFLFLIFLFRDNLYIKIEEFVRQM